MENRALFETYAAAVLARLYGGHPTPTDMSVAGLLKALGHESSKEKRSVAGHTINWLIENGYARGGDRAMMGQGADAQLGFSALRLTDKGFVALNEKINFRTDEERAGDVLLDELKTSANQTRNAVIGEVIGHIFGGLMKSVSS